MHVFSNHLCAYVIQHDGESAKLKNPEFVFDAFVSMQSL